MASRRPVSKDRKTAVISSSSRSVSMSGGLVRFVHTYTHHELIFSIYALCMHGLFCKCVFRKVCMNFKEKVKCIRAQFLQNCVTSEITSYILRRGK